jgi:hypothetical protein
VHAGGFARSRRPHDRNKFAVLNIDRKIDQRLHCLCANEVFAAQLSSPDDWHAHELLLQVSVLRARAR